MQNIYLFNPTCEMAIANDTVSYMPPAHLRKFEADIAPLMGLAGSGNDGLISTNKEDVSEFQNFMGEMGIDWPQVCTMEEVGAWNSGEIGKLSPWGWSRAAHRILTPLKKFCSDSFLDSSVAEWRKSHREFYSRRTSVLFLKNFRARAESLDYISIPYTPIVVNSVEQINKWMSENKTPYVFKTPWSSSGRGLYPVLSEQFVARSEVWVKSRLKQQKELIVEPWLKKVQDFSFQFYIYSGGRIGFLGVNLFEAGAEGNFEREYIGSPQKDKYEEALKCLPGNWIQETKDMLFSVLEEQGYERDYCGPVGIDGIIFKDEMAKIKVHPCIEINFRHSMGLVNLELSKKIHSDAIGSWKISQFKPGEWSVFVKQNSAKHPACLANGKVISGFLPLVPFSGKQLFGAWAELV